jgi:hypothetical protein
VGPGAGGATDQEGRMENGGNTPHGVTDGRKGGTREQFWRT